MPIFQISDAEIKSFNELRNNHERYAVISTITKDDIFKKNDFTEDVYVAFKNIDTITTIKKSQAFERSIYTWNEVNVDNFDITSKLQKSKSFKILARVKKVSKFNPKIDLL